MVGAKNKLNGLLLLWVLEELPAAASLANTAVVEVLERTLTQCIEREVSRVVGLGGRAEKYIAAACAGPTLPASPWLPEPHAPSR